MFAQVTGELAVFEQGSGRWVAPAWAAGFPNRLSSLRISGGSLESATTMHCKVTDPWCTACRQKANFHNGSWRFYWSQTLKLSLVCFLFAFVAVFRIGGESEQVEKRAVFVSMLLHCLLNTVMMIIMNVCFFTFRFTVLSLSVTCHLFSAEMLRNLRRFTNATSSWRSKTKPCRTPSVSWRKGNFLLHIRENFNTCRDSVTKTSNFQCFQAPCRRVWSLCRLGGGPEKYPGSEFTPRHQAEWVFPLFSLLHCWIEANGSWTQWTKKNNPTHLCSASPDAWATYKRRSNYSLINISVCSLMWHLI